MKNTSHDSVIKKLGMWAVIVVIVLSIPFIGNAFWTTGDFIFVGIVLFSLATMYELTTRNITNKTHRFVIAFIIIACIGLIMAWAATGPD